MSHITKEGEMLKTVEQNLSPYIFPAFAELVKQVEELKARITELEGK